MEGLVGELSTVLRIDLFLETLLPHSCRSSCSLNVLSSLSLYLSHVDLQAVKDKESMSLSVYEQLKLNLLAPHHLVCFEFSLFFNHIKINIVNHFFV